MTSFRFFHAADIHLDSPLRGLAGQDGEVAERIRAAPRAALAGLVDAAIAEKADFMVIAGDLYDGDWRDYNTGLFFVRQMGRLNEAGIPVFLLYGNHDAQSRIAKELALPGNVRVFGSRQPQTLRPDGLDVALHGQSFKERAETRNLAQSYPEPVAGAFNIGVLHTALEGRAGHDTYAPCSLADLVNKGYDYWALGHVHQSEVVRERPHVVFPGNLQGRHARETGPKGAVLVTVADGEVAGLEWRYGDVVRWTEIAVDAAGADAVSDVADRLPAAIDAAVAEEADGRLLACRIAIRGDTAIHDRLHAGAETLLNEARAAALAAGDGVAWIERVRIATRPLGETPPEDAVADLLRLLADAADDPDLLGLLEADAGKLADQLPPEIRDAVEDSALRAAVDRDYRTLIGEVTPWLHARLAGSGE